ncbi:uncharacterized protein G2W53_015744 [Senna tora]|uniref:Retrotransposon Copia-like N-terminal domain-containing protein n=1 Tax=Senna tora TaxID=362788 RepID=A0A835C5Y8_9FABA|nr:uncharacterized protein G2W53_015744 [Senna tora]
MEDETRSSSNKKETNEASYRLHNFDHPGMPLVNTTLDGNNYFGWSIAIRTALEAKDKLGFIDGSLPPPEDPIEYKKWKTLDSMIKSWIRNSLTKELADTFICCLSSKNLWDVLEERFGASNFPRFFQVQQEICSTHEGGDSVTTYYNKLHKWWDELDKIMPTLSCSCEKCTTQILNLDPLPSIKKAYNIVITDEFQRQVNLSYTNNAEGSIMARSTPGRTDGNYKKREVSEKDKYCEHCNANGHTKDTCFKIHRYPEWWKEMKEKSGGAPKKQMVANVAEKTVADTSLAQETEQGIKGDLANMVSYLIKEEQKTKKIIAKGTVVGNLYYLNKIEHLGMDTCNATYDLNKGGSFELWHARMDHPSVKVLQHINEISISGSLPIACDIRHVAKQHSNIPPPPTPFNPSSMGDEIDHPITEEIPKIERRIAVEEHPIQDTEPAQVPEEQNTISNHNMEVVRRSSRQRKAPAWLDDYVCLSKSSEVTNLSAQGLTPSFKYSAFTSQISNLADLLLIDVRSVIVFSQVIVLALSCQCLLVVVDFNQHPISHIKCLITSFLVRVLLYPFLSLNQIAFKFVVQLNSLQ